MTPREILEGLAETGTPPQEPGVEAFSTGLSASLERFDGETLPFVAAGGSDLQFVAAPYGRGKTHYLMAIRDHARSRGFVTAYVDCQDQTPFRSLPHTYRAIAAAMEPPERGNYYATIGVGRVVEQQFVRKDGRAQRRIVDEMRSDKALSPDFRNLVRAFCDSVLLAQGDEELASRLESLLAGLTTYGMSIGTLYRRYPDLPRPLGRLSTRNALVWTRALLSLPRVMGYPGLVVLFDETETTINRRTRSRQMQLAHMRTFVDQLAVGSYSGCVVYYAVAGEMAGIAMGLDALQQRLERVKPEPVADAVNPRAVTVDLDELTKPNPDDAEFFIELADRIVGMGVESGLSSAAAGMLKGSWGDIVQRHMDSISEGRVRKFVKSISTDVLGRLDGRTETYDGH